MVRAIEVGRLVVLRGQLERGVLRVERLLDVDGVAHARVLGYRDGRFSVVPLAALAACPAGTAVTGAR